MYRRAVKYSSLYSLRLESYLAIEKPSLYYKPNTIYLKEISFATSLNNKQEILEQITDDD